MRIADDGAIYVANLASPGLTAPFKIYRWENELPTTVPTTAYNATNNPTNARIGDTMDVFGSAAGTVLAFGESTSGDNTGNGYAVFRTSGGVTFDSATKVTFPLAPAAGGTANGDFNRSLTFTTESTMVLGKATNINPLRVTSYDSETGQGTLLRSPAVLGSMVDYAIVGGVPLLATLNMASVTPGAEASSVVRIYDFSDPASPVLLGSTDLTTTTATAGGNPGSIVWGEVEGASATLYALSVNNGIQGLVVTVPEPSTVGLLGLAAGGLLLRRRRR